MNRPVVVIVGAGASHVSGDVKPQFRPPLTKSLFDRDASRELLTFYTLARQARNVIFREMASDDTIAFEAALLNLQNDGYDHHRQMALAVPPFLQALLLHYSKKLAADARRYEVLVDELLKLPSRVVFINLNYDTLLDNQLGAFAPLTELDAYIRPQVKWSLIKPHGSVNWFVRQPFMFDPKAPPPEIDGDADAIAMVPSTTLDLYEVRDTAYTDPHRATDRYPAIAMPDGPKDRLVLPPSHLEALRNVLATAGEIDLLVLGYSALDTEILALVRESGCEVRRLSVVNVTRAATVEVFDRITDSGIAPIFSDTVRDTYAQWVDGPGLRAWVAEYDGPFDSVTGPDTLRAEIVSEVDAANQ